ncbi:MAG: hypothetical protein ACK4FB_08970 [Brevundimonas sp.]|uniref:hypothetical protein n=1 Tax=Brevundimonas sp. TaxID=1871086 RepID=UPI00391C40CA
MSGGVRAALEQVVDGQGGMEEVVQAGLFDDDLTPEETGALDAPSPLSAALPSTRRKAGRPKGAKNRRTEAVTSWLLAQHRHPLSVMMEAYSMSPEQLAERIGLAKVTRTEKQKRQIAGGIVEVEVEVPTDRYSNDVLLDLLKLQVRMAEAVAPYVAQKLPQAVQLQASASLLLSFGGVDLGGGVSDPARGEAGEISVGDGMAVKLGKSDDQSRTDD